MIAMNVATFEKLEPADTLKNRLEQAGVHAVVHDESWLQRYVFWTQPAATKKVEVDQDDFLKARHFVEEWDKADGLLREAIHCPECHSSRSEYPQYTRRFFTPIVVELFASLGLFPKEYYCPDCQYTWPKTPEAKPELDELGWPVEKRRKMK
jgi:hypothetical protein